MLYGMLLIDKIKCTLTFKKLLFTTIIKNMNNVINKFLLAGDKFMPEMHLREARFVYSACGPFTRHKERIKNLKKLVIRVIFIEMNSIKLVFNMILLINRTK